MRLGYQRGELIRRIVMKAFIETSEGKPSHGGEKVTEVDYQTRTDNMANSFSPQNSLDI